MAMFERFAEHDTIVVTGPQRSGTHICAEMIAHDLGYQYVDDSEFGAFNRAWFNWMCKRKGVVIHAPGMARWIHEIPRIFVVWTVRSFKEIHASEERINWSGIQREWEAYGVVTKKIAEVKSKYWHTVQSKILGKCCAEVKYNSLKGHGLWIPKEQRKNFKWDQTTEEYKPKTVNVHQLMAGKYPDPYLSTEAWIDSVKAPHFFGFVEELKAVIEHMPYRPQKILGIGYERGISAALWLTMIDDSEVISVDPFSPGEYAKDHVVDNLNDQCYQRWTFKKGTAEEILPGMTEQFDMLFLDSDHGSDTSPMQIREAWKKVKPGGMLAGHDYWSRVDSVGVAVDEWAMETGIIVHMARPHSREGVWWTEPKGE
jgi:hypothetical protein